MYRSLLYYNYICNNAVVSSLVKAVDEHVGSWNVYKRQINELREQGTCCSQALRTLSLLLGGAGKVLVRSHYLKNRVLRPYSVALMKSVFGPTATTL